MIKFTYFDIGGVAIRDFSETTKWDELKRELNITSDKDQDFENIYDLYKNEINTSMPIDALIPILKEKLGVSVPNDYSFLVDGFIKRFAKNEFISSIIEEIQKTSKIGLLTNMYPNMLNEIIKAGLLPETHWDVVVDSSVELTQKPDLEIYKIAESKSGFSGAEILFIDNMQKNLDIPKKLGWETFFYDTKNCEDSSKKLLEYFKSIN